MGELEAWARFTMVRRLCGQDSIGPSAVPDQSLALMTLAISPPPSSQCSGASVDGSGPMAAGSFSFIDGAPLRDAGAASSLLPASAGQCEAPRVQPLHRAAVHTTWPPTEGRRLSPLKQVPNKHAGAPLAGRILAKMDRDRVTRTELVERMRTSRTVVNRLLDPSLKAPSATHPLAITVFSQSLCIAFPERRNEKQRPAPRARPGACRPPARKA